MININRNISIMGIVNLTDNSYFAKSRCLNEEGKTDIETFIKKVSEHLNNGAEIIDIGACSTRPGSVGVGEIEEWNRIEPALDIMKKEFPKVRISIDTYWSSVVQKTYDKFGDFIVNDISSGEDDDKMLETVGKLGLDYIAMHKRGNPQTMQNLTDYGKDVEGELSAVTKEVYNYFKNFSEAAKKYGIKNWILDPGFGFAKTIDQNYQLLKEMDELTKINPEILVGVSRKSMIFRLFGITPEDALPATQALHLEALQKGATILRVHDVAEAKQVVDIYRKLS